MATPDWKDVGVGIKMCMGPAVPALHLSRQGLCGLEGVGLPVLVIGTEPPELVWRNGVAKDLLPDDEVRRWVTSCHKAASDTALGRLTSTLRDVVTPTDFYLNRLSQLPFAWTFHAHPVTLDGRRLLIVHAPSLLEPPCEEEVPNETAMERVVRMIDRQLMVPGQRGSQLRDLRERVLAGRMQEPMAIDLSRSGDVAFSWDTSASLAVMLGLSLDGPACPWIRQ